MKKKQVSAGQGKPKLNQILSPSESLERCHQTVFKTVGTLKSKYCVYIFSNDQQYVSHIAGMKGPEEALRLAMGDFRKKHPQLAVTKEYVCGYYRKKNGTVGSDVHFPPAPAAA